jgi:hypothetical protein
MLLMSYLICPRIKDPMPEDGACVFTGKAAIIMVKMPILMKKGHTLLKNQPLVCDKTAQALADLNRDDIYISESTFHYNGGGCKTKKLQLIF